MEIFDFIIGSKRPASWVLEFWPVLVTSLAASLLATYFCKKVAIRFGIVDKPDDLVKTHKEPIAYLGGVGMLIGLAVGVLTAILLLRGHDKFVQILTRLMAILCGGVIACFVGLIDDLFDIKPKQKILGQIVAAAVLILAGVVPNFDFVLKTTGWQMPGWMELMMEILIVIVFVLGATNSLNLLDGLDGLCGGVTAIITVAMFLLAAHLATWDFSAVGDPVRIVVCLGLIGGVCGFLPFNRYPAKIFMGDAGSMLLGFNVAALMILFGEKIPRWWMASIVVFGLPILDTAVALVRRFVNHRPLFVSDRGHVYDQLIDRGISLKGTVAICYLLSGLYALIGLVMSQIRTRYAAIVYVVVIVVSALVVWKKGFLKMEGLRGAIRKEHPTSNTQH